MSTPSYPSAHPGPPTGARLAPKRGIPTWGTVGIVAGGLVVLCCIGLTVVVILGGDATQEGFEDGLDGGVAVEASPTPIVETPTADPTPEPSTTPSPTEVPVLTIPDDLAGENAAIAEDRLRELGFTRINFGSVDTGETVVLLPANWTVVEVEPEGGTEVRADSLIVLRCTKEER